MKELFTGKVIGGVVVFTGELDVAVAKGMWKFLLGGLRNCRDLPGLIVDLSGVTYMDASGLGQLIKACKHLRESNKRLHLVIQGTNIRRILEITGMESVFGIFETQEGAIEGFKEPPTPD